MKPLLIYGSSEFGRTVKSLARRCGREVAGFVDDFNQGPEILGNFDFASERFPASTHEFVLAVGYRHLRARWTLLGRLLAKGYALPSLIHPRAIIETSKIGMGSIALAGAIVDESSEIGELCVLWNGANISHDCRIGANSFIAPSATICGFSSIGENCFIGANSTLTERTSIEGGRFVRAGSLVTPATAENLPLFDPARAS